MRTVSSKFFDTQVPSVFTEKLGRPRHARCVLPRPRCYGHSLLLNSYLYRIGRSKNPSCSACCHPSQDRSHVTLCCPTTDICAARFFVNLSLSTTSGPGTKELSGSWSSMVFCDALIPRKRSFTTTEQKSDKQNWQLGEKFRHHR